MQADSWSTVTLLLLVVALYFLVVCLPESLSVTHLLVTTITPEPGVHTKWDPRMKQSDFGIKSQKLS